MTNRHKNKTIATLLSFSLGGLGAQRLYLHGWGDKWAWAHFLTLPLSGLIAWLGSGQILLFSAAPLIMSMLVGFIEALVLGLTPDEKWDATYNPQSGRVSASAWPLVLILVLSLGFGATALIAAMARMADLLATGGSYG
jgi:hypothetical protein